MRTTDARPAAASSSASIGASPVVMRCMAPAEAHSCNTVRPKDRKREGLWPRNIQFNFATGVHPWYAISELQSRTGNWSSSAAFCK